MKITFSSICGIWWIYNEEHFLNGIKSIVDVAGVIMLLMHYGQFIYCILNFNPRDNNYLFYSLIVDNIL